MIAVVLDANVVISGTIAPLGSSARILDAWRAEYLDVIECPALIEEVAEKLRLPRIRDKYALTDALVDELLLRLTQVARLVPGAVEV